MNMNIAKTVLSYRSGLTIDARHRRGMFADTPVINTAIMAIATDLAQLGYTLSPELVDELRHYSLNALKGIHADTVSLIKNVLGADVKYAPLFRKFPDEIPDRSVLVVTYYKLVGPYAYLLEFAIFGKWSSDDYNGSYFGRQYPGVTLEEAIKRPELISRKPLKLLNVVSEGDVSEIFTNLVSARGSISETDKKFVTEFVNEHSAELLSALPDEFPNKENLTFLVGAATSRYGVNSKLGEKFLSYMKTATDVLRTAAAFSGSDVSLAEHSRFKLSNSQRKFILTAIEALPEDSALEDMMRFRGLWLVLAKYLHVGAYATQYPQAAYFVNTVRNNEGSIRTFNKAMEWALLTYNFGNATELNKFLKLAASRPGDFARRLDHILRMVGNVNAKTVVTSFLSVADKVATPLLLNLATHMYYRDSAAGVRVFMPKGSTTHATVYRGDYRALLTSDLAHTLSAGISDVLKARFANLPKLGKVYIDPALNDILVPTSMRNASESLKTVARGSKFQLDPNTNVVRLFLYWEDQEEGNSYNTRVDVDLSVQMLDANFSSNGVVSYYNLRNKGIVHSGDFTSAPNGASEFIDVDINEVLRYVGHDSHNGTRYVAVTVNSYTGQAFNTFTAKAGYMERDGKTGKSFEPKSVEQKYDVTAGTKFAVPMLLDLHERKVIWLDVGLRDSYTCTNIGHKGADLATLSQYAVEMYREKANLTDLLLLHTSGRADSVTFKFDPDETYDTVFDMKFAARVDEIMSKWIV